MDAFLVGETSPPRADIAASLEGRPRFRSRQGRRRPPAQRAGSPRVAGVSASMQCLRQGSDPAGATVDSADVVIVGGGIVGSATAYFLSSDAAFRDRRIVMIERDTSYAE